MRIDELFSLVLLFAAIGGMGVALGAVITWRLVHMKANPPPLPVWIVAVELGSISLFGMAGWILGQWLLVGGMALIAVAEIAQLVVALRAREG
jgi:hypothetical protein